MQYLQLTPGVEELHLYEEDCYCWVTFVSFFPSYIEQCRKLIVNFEQLKLYF